ncbi:MAG: BatA domain-containing protein [Candidatus Brocadiia bacterium]
MIEFAAPGFLWALPAVAVPVVIHLLFRRRYRTVPWAAMQHLLRAERASRRSIRWRYLLLLALRVAAVVLLVLLFARPGLTGALPGTGGIEQGTEVVVLLDASASMEHRPEQASAFERATDYVRAVADRITGRGAGMTVLISGRTEPVFSGRLGDGGLEELQAALADVTTHAAPLKPERELDQLAQLAAERARFHVVTDLRAEDWGRQDVRPGVQQALAGLQERGPVRIVDVGGEGSPGAAVARIEGEGRFVYAGSRAVFRALLTNDGPDTVPAGQLEVQLDGAALAPVAHPEVPPGDSVAVPVPVEAPPAGSHVLGVALRAEDAFPPDDRRFLGFRSVDQAPVLVVEGRPGSARYLRAALRPTSGPGLRPEVRPASGLPPAELKTYAAVFLCDVRDPTLWADDLAAYVSGGGRLVAFLGPHTDPVAWNSSALAGEDGLIPVLIGQSAEGVAALERFTLGDPLLAPFAGWQPLFGAAQFRRFRRVRPLEGARVPMRFGDADASAAMVAIERGEGLAVLFPTTADDTWHDWPRSELGRAGYVALMLYLVEHGPAARPELNVSAGQPLSYPTAAGQAGAAVLQPPGRSEPQTVRPRLLPDREGLHWTSEPLLRAGLGRLRPPGQGEVLFAVNMPDTERRLGKARHDVVRRAGRGGRLRVVSFDARLPEGTERAGAGLWPLLAGLLALVLVTESALAHLFSNPGAAPEREGGRPWTA